MPQVRVGVMELGEAASADRTQGLPGGCRRGGAVPAPARAAGRRRSSTPAKNLRQFYRLRQLRAGLITGGRPGVPAHARVRRAAAHAVLPPRGPGHHRPRSGPRRGRRLRDASTARFPKLPTTTENLRVTMQKWGLLTKQSPRAGPADRRRVARRRRFAARSRSSELQWTLTAESEGPHQGRLGGAPPAAGAQPAPSPVPGAPGGRAAACTRWRS